MKTKEKDTGLSITLKDLLGWSITHFTWFLQLNVKLIPTLVHLCTKGLVINYGGGGGGCSYKTGGGGGGGNK